MVSPALNTVVSMGILRVRVLMMSPPVGVLSCFNLMFTCFLAYENHFSY